MIALGTCWIHKQVFEFDPDTVITVLIDPQTGRPPDVDADGNPCRPEPGAVQRSVQQVICDPCMDRVNAGKRAAGYPVFERAEDRSGFAD